MIGGGVRGCRGGGRGGEGGCVNCFWWDVCWGVGGRLGFDWEEWGGGRDGGLWVGVDGIIMGVL